jgi:hypothetical protein
MAPIEAFFSSSNINEKVTTKTGEHNRFHFYDVNVDLQGETEGGTAIIKRHCQKKTTEINLKPGQTQEKTYSVVAKGGVVEKVTAKFIGK